MDDRKPISIVATDPCRDYSCPSIFYCDCLPAIIFSKQYIFGSSLQLDQGRPFAIPYGKPEEVRNLSHCCICTSLCAACWQAKTATINPRYAASIDPKVRSSKSRPLRRPQCNGRQRGQRRRLRSARPLHRAWIILCARSACCFPDSPGRVQLPASSPSRQSFRCSSAKLQPPEAVDGVEIYRIF